MCYWGGNGNLFFFASSFLLPSSPLKSPTHNHIQINTIPLPVHQHQYRWYPTENPNASHLVCQPSHFRCRGNISQDGSSERAHTAGIWHCLCAPPGTGKVSPVGSTDGIRGCRAKRVRGRGRRRGRNWRFQTDRVSPLSPRLLLMEVLPTLQEYPISQQC